MKQKHTVRTGSYEDRAIVVSTGVFFKWFASLPLSRELEDYLLPFLSAKPQISGFEFSVTIEALRQFKKEIATDPDAIPGRWSFLSKKLRSVIATFPSHHLHLSGLETLSRDEIVELATLMNEMSATHNFGVWTFHPDTISRENLVALAQSLSPQVVLSAENMDPHKKEFRSLAEMHDLLSEVPSLACTFDISHWLAHGFDAHAEELITFLTTHQQRIKALHLSVPTSRCKAAKEIKDTGGHYLLAESGWHLPAAFFDALPPSLAIILEGAVPVDHFDMLQDEILVTSLLTLHPSEGARPKVRARPKR